LVFWEGLLYLDRRKSELVVSKKYRCKLIQLTNLPIDQLTN